MNTEQKEEFKASATWHSWIAFPDVPSRDTLGFVFLGLMIFQNCLGFVRMRLGNEDEKKVRLVLDRSQLNFFEVARYFSHVRGLAEDYAVLNCLFLFLLSRFKVALNHGDAIRSVIFL